MWWIENVNIPRITNDKVKAYFDEVKNIQAKEEVVCLGYKFQLAQSGMLFKVRLDINPPLYNML